MKLRKNVYVSCLVLFLMGIPAAAQISVVTKNGGITSDALEAIDTYGAIGSGKGLSLNGEIIDAPLSVVFAEVTSDTGKIWMDRNLGATQVAASSTDAASYGDLYQWGRGADGHQIRTSGTTDVKSSSTSPGSTFIKTNGNWYTGNDNLWQGVNGINNPCPSGYRLPTDAEWDAERITWSSNNAAGAYASPLKLPMGGQRNKDNGELSSAGTGGLYYSSTVISSSSSGILYFYSGNAVSGSTPRGNGLAVRCLKEYTAPDAPGIGTAVAGLAQATVEFTAPLTNGGAAITTYTVTSSPGGITATGAGSPITITGLTNGTAYTFSVTATNSVGTGAASAASNSVTPATVPSVTNLSTGKIWMDRNLGAARVATSSTDADSYGDLYQWGRGADGHQIRTSGTTGVQSSSTSPGSTFIAGSNNWYTGTDPDNLWQGVNGTNNPCPSGYRLPTEAEWEAERATWSSNDTAGAFASPLKLPMAGLRYSSDGSLINVNNNGYYWSGTVISTNSRYLDFSSGSASSMNSSGRAYGFAVRCIKD